MMPLVNTMVPLLVLFTFAVQVCSSTTGYYSIAVTSSSGNLNRLVCRLNSAGNLPDEYTNAQWLYNNRDYSDNACFNSSIKSGSSLEFNLTSECDGYIQCGNGSEYSRVFKLIAPVQRTSNYRTGNTPITKTIGSSVRLLCNIRVSAIKAHNVRWTMRSTLTPGEDAVDVAYNEDYSLTLTNLSLSSKIYSCRVNTPGDSDDIQLGQSYKLVVVDYRFPDIVNLVASTTGNMLSFSLSARGTNLNYAWYLDGKRITDGITSATGTSDLRLEPPATERLQNLSAIINNSDISEGNRINRDSALVYLYPVTTTVTATATTTTTTMNCLKSTSSLIPTITNTPPAEGFMERNIVYIGAAGAIGCVLLIALIILIVIIVIVTCFCCCMIYKKRKCGGRAEEIGGEIGVLSPFTAQDYATIDKLSSKMMSYLLQVKEMEGVNHEVRIGINNLIQHLTECLDLGPSRHEYTYIDPVQHIGASTQSNHNIASGQLMHNSSVTPNTSTSSCDVVYYTTTMNNSQQSGNSSVPQAPSSTSDYSSTVATSECNNSRQTQLDGSHDMYVTDSSHHYEEIKIRQLVSSPIDNTYTIEPAQIEIISQVGAANDFPIRSLSSSPSPRTATVDPLEELEGLSKKLLERLLPNTVNKLKSSCSKL